MASAEDLDDDVTCGVTEDEDKITLMYSIGDCKDVTWKWIKQDSGHVAQMIARDKEGGGNIHESKPVPDSKHSKLGSPSKSKVKNYYKVEMSRKDDVSIEEYF